MKKLVIVLLVTLIGVGFVYASGQQGGEASGSRVMPTPPGTFPVVEEKVTLKLFAPQYATVENMDTNLLTLEYEEKSNVHIDWQLAPEQGFTEKRNLIFASGDYPDAFIASNIPPADQMLYGQQGVLIPHNDLIDEWTVHVKSVLERVEDLKKVLTATDGNIYTLGTDGKCYHCAMSQKLWMYTPWLEALGLESPKTTDELYQVLKAFRDGDPNGNGDTTDEIPLAGATTGWNTSVVPFIMNSFIYDDGTDHLTIDNGDIDVAFNKPEWKDGLAYLKMLNDEELIDSTSFTMQIGQLKQIIEKDGVVRVGTVPAGAQGSFISWAGETWHDYWIVEPLVGPDGVQGARYASTAGPGRFAITSASEMPEVAIRWVDWFYNWEGGVRSRIGREGYEWARAEPGEKAIDGSQAEWKKLTPIGTIQNFFWGQGNWPQQFTHSKQGGGIIETQLYSATNIMMEYRPDEYVLPLWVGGDDIQEYSQLRTDINDYVTESTARFITGGLDLGADWDAYLKTLDSMGADRYVELINTWYSAKYGN
jgi:putative aldouronate transport system substrate-binding protein